ncbi:PAS domain S-box protein [bacterium]|nr:PAS domain S-box protein [bacterium]
MAKKSKGARTAGRAGVFREIVAEIGRRLEADAVLLAENRGGDHAAVLAAWPPDGPTLPSTLDLSVGPGDQVLQGRVCLVPAGLGQSHPEERLGADLAATSYLAIPLMDSAGNSIGALVAYCPRPLSAETVDDLVLHALALRAATELERLRSATELETFEHRLSMFLSHLPHVVLYETGGGREFISENVQTLLGYPAAEFKDRSFFPSLIHPDDAERTQLAVKAWRQRGEGEALQLEFRARHKNGAYIWLLDHLAMVRPESGDPYMTGVLVEVTEQKAAEEELRRHTESEALVASISTRLLGIHPGEEREAASCALSSLAGFMSADRAFMALFGDDGASITMAEEWAAPGIAGGQEGWQDVPSALYPWMTGKMLAGETVRVLDPDELPDEAAALCESMGRMAVGSLLVVPVATGERPWGFLCVANTGPGRIWTDEEAALLLLVGEILSGALARYEAEADARAGEERLRLATGQVPAVLWTTDAELCFTSSMGAGLAALGLLPDEVVGQSLRDYFGTEECVEVGNEVNELYPGRVLTLETVEPNRPGHLEKLE